MTDRDVQIELNFIDEFELSRQGMIDEIKTEFDIIRFCVSNMTKYKISAREMFDRIMIMPLRKLLCEKNSVLLKVCPDFNMGSPFIRQMLYKIIKIQGVITYFFHQSIHFFFFANIYNGVPLIHIAIDCSIILLHVTYKRFFLFTL